MDISLELHCDKCGSANLAFPAEAAGGDRISCNDCGDDQGSLAELREELLAAALAQSSEALRRGLDRES